ncbi:MAG TPA: sugar phosphate nucleotidyltransferase [Candidatus Eremiobacteraceae bacterium]
MPAAVIMAGGRSSRMRATYGPEHKALVEVLGVSLLERNLTGLIVQGFDDVTIAVAASEGTIHEWARSRGQDLAASTGARLTLYLEEEPLGTIGALGAISTTGATVVVNVDNLSAIDLGAFLREHEASGAAMSVAVHVERFSIPFGEVRVADGCVVEYSEKPERSLLISSGTYVLGRTACEQIGSGRRCNVPELVRSLNTRGGRVHAFKHDSPWIDVNDAAGVARAEALVARHADRFSPAAVK